MSQEADEDEILDLVSREGDHFRLPSRILCMESLYFQGLLSSGMKESSKREVVLKAVSSLGLRIICSWLLEQSVHELTSDNVPEALNASNYLQIARFTDMCLSWIQENLTCETCDRFLELGDALMMPDVYNIADTYRKRNMKKYSMTKSFRDLDAASVWEFLSADDVGRGDEMEAFHCAMQWCMKGPTRGIEDIKEVMGTIRWGLLTNKNRSQCLESLSSNNLATICQDIPSDITVINDCAHGEHAKMFRVRRGMPCFVATGGFTEKTEKSSSHFQILPLEFLRKDSAKDSVIRKTLPDKRALKRRRCNDRNRLSTEDRLKVGFIFGKNRRLPASNCEHACCVLDNFLYIAGGQSLYTKDGLHTHDLVWRYNTGQGVWTEVGQWTRYITFVCMCTEQKHFTCNSLILF